MNQFTTEQQAAEYLLSQGFRRIANGVYGKRKYRAYITAFEDVTVRNWRNNCGSPSSYACEIGVFVSYYPHKPLPTAKETHEALREKIGGLAWQ